VGTKELKPNGQHTQHEVGESHKEIERRNQYITPQREAIQLDCAMPGEIFVDEPGYPVPASVDMDDNLSLQVGVVQICLFANVKPVEL